MIHWMLAIWSSSFLKHSFYIWKFSVHVLLKPSLENFEHYFASVWNKCNCAVVWTFLALPVFGIGMKTDLFHCGHCWDFQICWHTEYTLTASPFRISNSSTGILSPPLALKFRMCKGFFKILNLVSRLRKVGVISRKMIMPCRRAGTVVTRKLSSFPTYSVVNGERALQLS